jgi:hypothetical protein
VLLVELDLRLQNLVGGEQQHDLVLAILQLRGLSAVVESPDGLLQLRLLAFGSLPVVLQLFDQIDEAQRI